MNRKQLGMTPERRTISTNLDIFSPLINYRGEPGQIPEGTVITITGAPGSGKTKYLYQVLNNIAQYNMNKPVLYEYEMGPAPTVDYLDSLQANHLNDFVFTKEVNQDAKIVGIDSLDFWASEIHGNSFPSKEEASILKKMKDNGSTIILVHHKTKNSKATVSGSAWFAKVNDVTIDLLKQKDGTVIATTRTKNRFAAATDQLVLEHTSNGLQIKKNLTPMDFVKNLYTRLTK